MSLTFLLHTTASIYFEKNKVRNYCNQTLYSLTNWPNTGWKIIGHLTENMHWFKGVGVHKHRIKKNAI